MIIKLKSLLEQIDTSPVRVQIYMDLDGVMADFDGGFKKLSGKMPREFESSPEFPDKKTASRAFWKLINTEKTFWEDLTVLPGALTLWEYVKDTYKNPEPIVLTAGPDGARRGKEIWVKKHLGANVKMILAQKGSIKHEYALSTQEKTLHVLVDDLKINIDNWNNAGEDFIGILHKSPAESITKLQNILDDEVSSV
jgi:tellurite resistance-related uncharacterized protein